MLYVLACGLCPCGLESPYTPDPPAAPPAMAAESYDQDTRDLASLTKSADPIDQQVQLALSAIRGTGAADSELGQRFADVRKLGDDAKLQIESEARTALARLVDNGDIQIVSIVVITGTDWAEVTIDYINKRAPGDQARSYTSRF